MSLHIIRPRAEELVLGSVFGAAAVQPFVLVLASTGLEPSNSVVAIIAAAGAVAGAAIMGCQAAITHVTGWRYYPDNRKARRALQALMNRCMSKAQRGGDVRGIALAGIELARQILSQGVFVTGQPGTGKTVVLSTMLQQSIRLLDQVVIHDPKGDYVTRLSNVGSHVVLLGPWDARAWIWDVSADIQGEAMIREFAGIVAGIKSQSNTANAFFYKAAQDLLAAIISGLPAGWVWSDLYSALTGATDDLIELAKKHDPLISLAFSPGKPTNAQQDVLSTFVTQVRWIGQMAAVDTTDRKRISLSRWLSDRTGPRVLILNFDSRYASTCEAIFGAMLSAMRNVIASPAMPEVDADAPGLLFLLDEMPQLGAAAIRAVQGFSEIGRSRGVRVVSAVQDPAQLEAILGRAEAAAVTAMAGTNVYCQLSAQAAADVATRIGNREIRRLTTATDGDARDGKQLVLERVPVILPGELAGLGGPRTGVEVVIAVKGILGRVVAPFADGLQPLPGVCSHEPSPAWGRGQGPRIQTDVVIASDPGIDGDDKDAEILP